MDRALRTGGLVHDFLANLLWMQSSFSGVTQRSAFITPLALHTFDSYDEVYPGVPLSRCGDLFWITKAGGFGDRDVLCEIRRRLS